MNYLATTTITATTLALATLATSVHGFGGGNTAQLPIEDGESVITTFPIGGCGNSGGYGMDPDGFVVQLVDTRTPPHGSNPVPTPGAHWSPPFHSYPWWTARNLGLVFGLALDEDAIPNIHVAATTVYGDFSSPMPCPQVPNGFGPDGPGAIYRLDGTTGAITPFAITGNGGLGTNEIPNSGPGLGNLCYAEDYDAFYVTNHEDGRIYMLDLSGTIVDIFDPFAPDNGVPGYAPLGERLWGVDVHDGYLYFSVWLRDGGRTNTPWNPNAGTAPPNPNNSIWRVPLDGVGYFAGTEQLQINLPYLDPGNSSYRWSNPVSDIAIAPDGSMILGEHAMIYDHGQIDLGHTARVLEYVNPGSWAPSGKDYFIGTLWNNQLGGPLNTSGGVDYDCEKNVWSSGDVVLYGPTIYGLQRVPNTGNTAATSTSTSLCVGVNGAIKGGVGDIETFKNYPCETGAPCDLQCDPAVHVIEDEPCGTDSNHGCEISPYMFHGAQCDTTICGTIWADGGQRDTDWYEFSVPDWDGDGLTELQVTLVSDFPGVVRIHKAECPNPTVIDLAESIDCEPGVAQACLQLDANGVFVSVKPETISGGPILNGYPCDSAFIEYHLKIECINICDPQVCPSDLSHDNAVDVTDLLILLASWGQCADCTVDCPADINGDCAVDVTDLLTLLGEWGPC